LLQLLGKNIPLNTIRALPILTPEGNLKVAGTWNWRYAPITDDAANTYATWQLLFAANTDIERRQSLLSFLSTESSSAANSLIKAADALVMEALAKDKDLKAYKPEIFINGQLLVMDKWPAKYHLQPGQTLEFKHQGAPVFLAANRTFKTYNPKSDSTQFSIQVSVPSLKNNHFKAGEPVEMKVVVFSKRNQYSAIIDVPIPAGCVYGSKIQNETYVETYREYKTDRTLIFCDELPFGYHTFTIRLMPKFNGSFYTPPARSALLFYPDKAAFTSKKRWTIGK
jgi:hypothetical protein